MDAVINLISVQQTTNDVGVPVITEQSRQIFCRTDNVSRREFFEAGRNGLNPELKFTVFAPDYDGELTVEYDGRRYGVYRTYRISDSDYMELYCERKSGTAPAAEASNGS